MSEQQDMNQVLPSGRSASHGNGHTTAMSREPRNRAYPTNIATQPTFEPVIGSEEAAALLNIHPKTLLRLARNGDVPGFRIGKLWGFRASALNQWLETRMTS